MQIKKFTADNYSQALARIKQEMGDEALILTTRSIREQTDWDGKGASKVEITAAIDSSANCVKSNLIGKVSGGTFKSPAFDEGIEPDMKSLLYSLLGQTERAQSMGLKSHQLELFSHLVSNGVNEKIIAKILSKSSFSDEGKNFSSMRVQFMEIMKQLIVCRGGIETSNGQPSKKVALVGPTGAGKTTTIAKIAADLVYRQRKKVALVSLDTFRVGAIEQLAIYGDIMKIPVEIAKDQTELEGCVRRHSNKDVILIDTMGRCHKDRAYSSQLSKAFEGIGEVETHLVLSIGSNEKQFLESHRQFLSLGINRVLFTKLDEGLSFGDILNFSLRSRLPLSYFTTGQRVPEDIEVATQDKVIRLIFN